MAKDVFISFASPDRTAAETVTGVLERRGFDCWICTRDVPPGGNYQESIADTIRAAKVMVIVFSNNANASDEIKKELSLASKQKLVVIPLMIEDAVPGAAFDYEFSTRQLVRAFEDWDRAMTQLANQIAAIVQVGRAAGVRKRKTAQVDTPLPTPPPPDFLREGGRPPEPQGLMEAWRWPGLLGAAGLFYALAQHLALRPQPGIWPWITSALLLVVLLLRNATQADKGQVANAVAAGIALVLMVERFDLGLVFLAMAAVEWAAFTWLKGSRALRTCLAAAAAVLTGHVVGILLFMMRNPTVFDTGRMLGGAIINCLIMGAALAGIYFFLGQRKA